MNTNAQSIYGSLKTHQPDQLALVHGPEESKRISCSTAWSFLLALVTTVLSGTTALFFAPTADVNFAELSDNAVCLRVGRRRDLTEVYLDVGSPLQRLKLLLDIGNVVSNETNSLLIFSTRMHKSQSMRCHDLVPRRDYAQQCHDFVLIAPNGSTSDRKFAKTTFTYQNDQVAYADREPAALARLDGVFRLIAGQTYWLTTTHICFAPLAPLAETTPALKITFAGEKMSTTNSDLLAYDRSLAFDERCNDALQNATVDLFPAEATNEASVWLSLSGRFLYEYGSAILDMRRAIVEAGQECSGMLEELQHQRDIYHNDCGGLAIGRCHLGASVPYRRLAERRMRIDLNANGVGTLISTRAKSLGNLKKNYIDALSTAISRLLVLILTAAVVFVRGSQNATSSRWLLKNTINTLHRCQSASLYNINREIDKWTDILISVTAWTSRLVVVTFVAPYLQDDNQSVVVFLQALGISCSFVQFLLRHGLKLRNGIDAPISTLGGPMSVIDVTSAVLMLFSNTPMLGASGDNFAAIGRLLVGVLISISVCTRMCFSVAIVTTMAVSLTNNRHEDLKCYRFVLWIATATWLLQCVATAGSLALLFVNPAAVSISRSEMGDTRIVKYTLFVGLICTSLPTFTKVSLRVMQHQCKKTLAF